MRDLFEAFTPEWFFRVGGVGMALVVVVTGSWPGNPKDG